MYKFLFKNQISQKFIQYTNTSDYMSYIIIGNIIYVFVSKTLLNISRSFITEMREGTLESLFLAPFKTEYYLLGNMLEHTVTALIEITIISILAIPFGLNLSNINFGATIFNIVISLFAFFGMAILLASIMLWFRDTFISQNLVTLLINLLCGVLFPINYLPKFVQFFSHIIPLTYSLKIFRSSMLLGQNIQSQLTDFSVLILLTLIYCFLGKNLLIKF